MQRAAVGLRFRPSNRFERLPRWTQLFTERNGFGVALVCFAIAYIAFMHFVRMQIAREAAQPQQTPVVQQMDTSTR